MSVGSDTITESSEPRLDWPTHRLVVEGEGNPTMWTLICQPSDEYGYASGPSRALPATVWLDPRTPSLVPWVQEREAWMLVITRKEGERIVIDDDIVITVVESKRGSVRIGIQAPPQVAIAREE